jgi:hypothetical protein
VEASCLRLFEAIGNRFGPLQRDLKMLFSSFPLTCGCCGDTRDHLRQAGGRPKRYRSSAYQLTSERIKLCGLRLLAEDAPR